MGQQSLPYDMGNAGDLLKHGVLAEFVRWRCGLGLGGKPFRFLDPFAGEPWGKPKDEVCRRVAALRKGGDFALPCAQSEIENGCYYGSSMLVKHAAENEGVKAEIYVSDCDEGRRRALVSQGDFCEIRAPGFMPEYGYSVLHCIRNGEINADLVLIDPFADFLPCDAERITPLLAKAAENLTVVLFVLNKRPKNKVGENWRKLKSECLRDAWILSCSPLPDCGVKGESDYWVEVVLCSPLLCDAKAGELKDKLTAYAVKLGKVLGGVKIGVDFGESPR